MLSDKMQALERAWENKAAQEELAQKTLALRADRQQTGTKFFLAEQEASRLWEKQAVNERTQQSSAQAKWLDQSWRDSKELAARRWERPAQESAPSSDIVRPAQADIRQPTPSRESASPTNEPSERAARSTPSTTARPPLSSPAKKEPELPNLEAKTSKMVLEKPTEAQRAHSGSEQAGLLAGTQSATRASYPMPGFQLPQQQTPRGRGWRQPADEEALSLAAASPLRQGALVEASANYKKQSVQENVLPRLQELVQRLSQMGHSWARVVIPVDDRTQVIVRFSQASSRVKIHLSSGSLELCQMIKDSWSGLAHSMGQRGIQLDDLTYDTSNL